VLGKYKKNFFLNFQTFDGNEMIKCIKKLISIDESWVPPATEVANALYIRPTYIGTEVIVLLCHQYYDIIVSSCCIYTR